MDDQNDHNADDEDGRGDRDSDNGRGDRDSDNSRGGMPLEPQPQPSPVGKPTPHQSIRAPRHLHAQSASPRLEMLDITRVLAHVW